MRVRTATERQRARQRDGEEKDECGRGHPNKLFTARNKTVSTKQDVVNPIFGTHGAGSHMRPSGLQPQHLLEWITLTWSTWHGL